VKDRYKVISTWGIDTLLSEINNLIEIGYIPLGGLIVLKYEIIPFQDPLVTSLLAQTMYLPTISI